MHIKQSALKLFRAVWRGNCARRKKIGSYLHFNCSSDQLFPRTPPAILNREHRATLDSPSEKIPFRANQSALHSVSPRYFCRCFCRVASLLPPPCRKFISCNNLPPLLLSLPSFSHRLSLFSIACKLFSQNTGGGVPPSRNSHGTPQLRIQPPGPLRLLLRDAPARYILGASLTARFP